MLFFTSCSYSAGVHPFPLITIPPPLPPFALSSYFCLCCCARAGVWEERLHRGRTPSRQERRSRGAILCARQSSGGLVPLLVFEQCILVILSTFVEDLHNSAVFFCRQSLCRRRLLDRKLSGLFDGFYTPAVYPIVHSLCLIVSRQRVFGAFLRPRGCSLLSYLINI